MILYGKPVADKLLSEARIYASTHRLKLVIIANQFDEASKVYVNNKVKKCKECNIDVEVINLPKGSTEYDFIKCIKQNNKATGIIVQLPIQDNLNAKKIISAIPPEQDVDGFGKNAICPPCTPAGIIHLLNYYKGKNWYKGKVAVVIGRSDIVGKPIAKLLLDRDMTVIQCHSKTQNLEQFTKQADLIISAVGKPNTVTSDMVKNGTTIIDVGINRVNGKICGDCDFDNLQNCDITPVPKGIGLTTVATLVRTLVDLDKNKKEFIYEA